jgi:hypothetical protein
MKNPRWSFNKFQESIRVDIDLFLGTIDCQVNDIENVLHGSGTQIQKYGVINMVTIEF